MKPKAILAALAVVAMASVCVRLGFWQISRLHQKQALNRALSAALVAPPVRIGVVPLPLDRVQGRRVEVRGRYDPTRHVLLNGRSRDGSPGVDVVTALVLPGDSIAVLVDRGWMYSADAQNANPETYPEPGEIDVLGLADSMRRGAGGMGVATLAAGSSIHYSARWLDLDSLSGRFPYRLAPYALRQLPGPGVPENPVRRAPHPFDEMMHVSYAVQWFLFASILVGGSAALAWSRRHPRGEGGMPSNEV